MGAYLLIGQGVCFRKEEGERGASRSHSHPILVLRATYLTRGIREVSTRCTRWHMMVEQSQLKCSHGAV